MVLVIFLFFFEKNCWVELCLYLFFVVQLYFASVDRRKSIYEKVDKSNIYIYDMFVFALLLLPDSYHLGLIVQINIK